MQAGLLYIAGVIVLTIMHQYLYMYVCYAWMNDHEVALLLLSIK